MNVTKVFGLAAVGALLAIAAPSQGALALSLVQSRRRCGGAGKLEGGFGRDAKCTGAAITITVGIAITGATGTTHHHRHWHRW